MTHKQANHSYSFLTLSSIDDGQCTLLRACNPTLHVDMRALAAERFETIESTYGTERVAPLRNIARERTAFASTDSRNHGRQLTLHGMAAWTPA